MSQYITGAGSACWGDIETTYGAGFPSVPHAKLLNMTSESISTTYNRLEEGTLLASKTRPAQDLSSVAVSGGISTILKPDFDDFAFKWAMGKENTTNPYTKTGYEVHEYWLADPEVDLPSVALYLDKGGSNPFLYDGMVVSSLVLDCPAQNFVTCDFNLTGHNETRETETPSPTKPVAQDVGSYKCTQAKLIHSTAGDDEIDDFTDFTWGACPAGILHEVWDVARTQLTIDNGLEDAPATYCSGLYSNQPSHGQRGVTLSCEVPYSASFETFRQTYYASENPDNLALMLAFCTKDTHDESGVQVPDNQIFIILPNVNIDGASANVGGQGLMNGSFTGTALSIGTTEPIKVITLKYQGN